jgi:hypothetical protein
MLSAMALATCLTSPAVDRGMPEVVNTLPPKGWLAFFASVDGVATLAASDATSPRTSFFVFGSQPRTCTLSTRRSALRLTW